MSDAPTPAQIAALKDVNDLIRELNNTNHATATNTTNNDFRNGNLAIAACAVSAACVVILIAALVMMGTLLSDIKASAASDAARQNHEIDLLNNQLRDNQAWVTVYGNRISTLEAKKGK